MAIIVHKRPEETINGKISRWSSANNPIIFQFESTDFLSKENYYVQICVHELTSDVLLSKKNYRPFTNGLFKVDVSGQLNSYLNNEHTYLFDQINKADINAQVKYYLTWQEIWEDDFNTKVTDTESYTAHNSALQLGFFDDTESVGPNLRDYSPFDVDVPELNKMKFLTKFEKPSYWPGFPFSLSWLFTEDVAGYDIRRVEERVSSNGAVLNNSSNQLLKTEVNHANFMQITGGYSSAIDNINLSIELGNKQPETYVYPGYIEEGYIEII